MVKAESHLFDKNYYFGQVYKNYDQFLDFQKLANDLYTKYDFESFLDIGCGCGNLVKEIKKIFNDKKEKFGQIKGVDFSKYAVKRANDGDIICADARDLPFSAYQFDLVYILGTFSYLDGINQINQAIREAYRACKKLIVFEDVYSVPEQGSDDFDPCRKVFYSQERWIRNWLEALNIKKEKIIKKGEEIIILK